MSPNIPFENRKNSSNQQFNDYTLISPIQLSTGTSWPHSRSDQFFPSWYWPHGPCRVVFILWMQPVHQNYKEKFSTTNYVLSSNSEEVSTLGTTSCFFSPRNLPLLAFLQYSSCCHWRTIKKKIPGRSRCNFKVKHYIIIFQNFKIF